MVDLLAASDVEEDAPSSPEQQPTPKQRLHCGAAGRRAPKRPWSAGPAECIIDLTCPDADGQAERDGEAARRCASLADGAHAEGTADAAVPRVKRTVHLQSAQLACSVDQQQQPLLPLQDAVGLVSGPSQIATKWPDRAHRRPDQRVPGHGNVLLSSAGSFARMAKSGETDTAEMAELRAAIDHAFPAEARAAIKQGHRTHHLEPHDAQQLEQLIARASSTTPHPPPPSVGVDLQGQRCCPSTYRYPRRAGPTDLSVFGPKPSRGQRRPPRVYVYKMPRDDNCAPCIDNDVLSLALCKGKIRSTAEVGDFLLGVVAKPGSCFPRKTPKPGCKSGAPLPEKIYRKELNLQLGDPLYLARVTHKISGEAYGQWWQPTLVPLPS